jgi:hypothetical protein
LRDILTGIAIILIVALTAALAAPPFVNWEGQREFVERVVRDALGAPVRTEGRIRVRLLPSPRLQLDSIAIGTDEPSSPVLRGRFVAAEVALTPLLRGEIRFVDARIGRLDLRVPSAPDGTWSVPEALITPAPSSRTFAFEQVRVDQLAITGVDASTGRTEQFFAQGVTIESPSLSGPWRLEGAAGGVPFRVVTGEPAADRSFQIKAAGGGDRFPRFDLDGRVGVVGAGRYLAPRLEGQLRVGFGPPGQAADAGPPLSVAVQANFKSEAGTILVERLTAEVGQGASALRLAGKGQLDFKTRTVDIELDGKRLDLDSIIVSPAWERLAPALSSPPALHSPWPVFFRIGLGSVAVAQDEINDVGLAVQVGPAGVVLHRIDGTAPGTSRMSFVGDAVLVTDGRADGHVEMSSENSDRLGRFLSRLGAPSSVLAPLDGRPVALSTDVSVADRAISLRNMRLAMGDGSITGALRYQIPTLGGRGKLEALIAAQNIDLAGLPQVGGMFRLSENLDLALTVDARGLRDGTRAGAGRVAAKIISDGPSLVVDTLDITDLAGANVRVSGRIAPDGSGRIAGKVTAQRAAPLVDLLGRVWSDTLPQVVPPFLREGALDLDVAVERTTAADGLAGLRSTARGTAAGGRLEADSVSDVTGPRSLNVTLQTPDTAKWLGAEHPSVSRRPSTLTLAGARAADGRFSVTGQGDVAGVRLATARPFIYAPADATIVSGEASLATGDLRPVLALLSLGATQAAVAPAELRIQITRERGIAQIALGGRIAGEEVRGRFALPAMRELAGDMTLDRLSLPWLAETLALGPIADARPPAIWQAARFADDRKPLFAGEGRVRVARFDLGRGVVAEDATFLLAVTNEGFALRDLEARLGQGRISGGATLTRQGRLVSIAGEGALADVRLDAVSGIPWSGIVSSSMRFGTSGESMALLINNLAGSGTVRVRDLTIPAADPAAVDRALARALRDDDPLASRKLDGFLAEEFARGPMTVPAISGSSTMVGGVLRLNALSIDLPQARWLGAVALDVRTLTLDIRGAMSSRVSPNGWSGSPPFAILGWRGPIAAPQRDVDAGPMLNGLASIVLQRELEKIEAFEAEANERSRLQSRIEYERDRRERVRRAAEEAERQARLQREREEAERLARIKAEQEAEKLRQAEAERQARVQREADRQAKIRADREAAERVRLGVPPQSPSLIPPLLPPLDITPPRQPGG